MDNWQCIQILLDLLIKLVIVNCQLLIINWKKMDTATNELIQQCTKVKQVIEDSMKWVSANVEKDKQAVTIYNLKKLNSNKWAKKLITMCHQILVI